MSLVQLIYASRVVENFPTGGAKEIIKVARRRNKEMNITGLLCFDTESFLQCLEGEREAVNRLYSKILTDSRHEDVVLLQYGEILQRSFPNWSMGLVLPSKNKRELFFKHSGKRVFDPFGMGGANAHGLLTDLAQSHKVA